MMTPSFVPKPAVLLYLPAGDRYPALADYLSGQDIRLISVASERCGETIGSLLGLEPRKPSLPVQLPQEPVIVLFGFSSRQSDKLLAFLHNHRQIDLKAMATPVNLKWTFARLAGALSKEHKQLNQ